MSIKRTFSRLIALSRLTYASRVADADERLQLPFIFSWTTNKVIKVFKNPHIKQATHRFMVKIAAVFMDSPPSQRRFVGYRH